MADYKKSQGEFVYPDANLSLRITFGNVMGYGKDGVKYTVHHSGRRGGKGNR